MVIQIIMESGKNVEVYDTAEKIHNTLVGNQDYIDSNIVLNFDNASENQTATLYFDADSCSDKELIRKKAKETIDIFIDSL